MYFFGETWRRSGPRSTRSPTAASAPACSRRRAGISTADTVILNIDHYTLLRNAIFSVKGVPLLYLPVIYYPTKEDDRATGFLLPTYGTSTMRGQTLSQRVLLGHQPQPGRDVHCTTGTRRPARGGRRVSLQPGRRLDGNLTRLYAGPAAGLVTTRRRGTTALPASPATRSTAAPTSCCRATARARPRQLLLEHRPRTRRFNTNVYDASRNSRELRRQRRRAPGAPTR